MNRTLLALVGACAFFTASAANAAAIIRFQETATGVEGVLSGTLDLTGAVYLGGASAGGQNFVDPFFGAVASEEAGAPLDVYTITGPASFGAGFQTVATSRSGDSFYLGSFADRLYIPAGFGAGDTLAATMFFAGQTYASLGIIPGAYVFSLPNDTFTVEFALAEVPLPAALPLFLAGLGGIAAARRRKRAA